MYSIWLTLKTMFLPSFIKDLIFIPLSKETSKVKKKKRRGYREKSQQQNTQILQFVLLLFNSSVHAVTEVLSLCTNTSHVKNSSQALFALL